MSQKILITYASRTGSTAEIAEAIGKTLSEENAQVDILPMQAVKDPSPYQAVIVGSAIRKSKWLDFDKLPFSLDALKLRATVAAGIFPHGDHRDWSAIHA